MKARLIIQASLLLLISFFSISAHGQLKADFTASPTSGCSPLIVHFTDQSTGNPTDWQWDLGNGTISFLQNPSASYFTPGQYTVKLVVKNASGADSIVKTQYISVAAKPDVVFSASVTSGCYPLPVQFTDQSTPESGTITNWQWDFGDGVASSDQNPLHTYLSAGNYNVTLRVTNSDGCLTTLSKTQYVQIGSGVTAAFSNSVPNKCSAPISINFQNLSTGTGALTYQWLFGDGTSSTSSSPSHIYNAAGSYTVQLIVTNATGCTDTITKANNVTVGNVSPSFTANDNVCVKEVLVITNTSTPIATSVFWDFGDGTTSTLAKPVKKYNAPGTYQIKMLANFGSCSDSAFKTVTVIPKPIAAFTADDSTNCMNPFTVNFTSVSVDADTYQWSFGDNTTSTLANPSHIYNAFGNFTVQLVVTGINGCTDTIRKTNFIKIIAPVALLKNLPDSGCVPFIKTFSSTVTSFDPVVSYLWNFGDGTTSTTATPTHTFTTAGIYTITLIVTTAGGCTDTTIVAKGVTVNDKPVAKFSATPTDACAKIPIVFTDQSLGNPIRWLWDFGDGTKSIGQSPAHKYIDSGYFTVQLIVWNSGCSDTVVYPKYVHINAPIARYTVGFNCNKPYERVFTDQSIAADTWNWDFGDGNTSTQKSPVHTYSSPGQYIVSLTVYNNASGCDFTQAGNVQIVDVKASFFASDTVVCRGSNITFNTNLSLTDVKAFRWNFGDGSVADSVRNFATHVYKTSGTYTVTLITTSVLNCKDTLVKSMYIRVNGPTAKFTTALPGSCLNSTILFNDSSKTDGIHPIQSWEWNYGDGITEVLTAAPFQHSYSKTGIYNVTLKVTDSEGCSDSFKIVPPLVISKPVAAFKTVDTLTCPGKPVKFTNLSSGPNLKYVWQFGDGATSIIAAPVHLYTADGAYDVKLSITDQYGCADSVSKPGYVSITTSVADFNMSDSFSTCPPLIVQFSNLSTNAVSQVWDFGDNTTANIVNPSHFYNYPGTYTISLAITGPGGCVEIKKKNIVINGPTGNFTYNPLSGCNPVTVNFSAKTKDRLSFIWDFNNGNTLVTTDSVISHTYINQGSYVPKMILVDPNGCQVPITGKDTILVSGVVAKLNFIDKMLCDAGSVSFADSSVSNDIITSYKWSFGDGQTAAIANPVHPYTATGLYYPKLIITTKNGCTDSISSAIPVKVVASPQIDLSKTADGCTPLAVTFTGLVTAPDTSALNWSWVFGNGNFSSLKNPAVENYTVSGIYNVSLTVTNSSGCIDTVGKQVNAFIIPTVSAGVDTTICKNIGVTLQATGANTYSWSPALKLSCTNCANPVATPDSVAKYVVRGFSGQGCSATDTVMVHVKYPFKIAYSKPASLCKGQDIKLFASGTDKFEWSPSTGLDNAFSALPTAQPDTTVTYRVIGTDDHGCFKDTGYTTLKVYPIPSVNAGPDQTINVGKTTDLVPTVSADVTQVVWSPTGAIFRNNYPAITVKPNVNTEYTVEVQNRGGCMTRDKVNVLVLCNGANIFIPNTFSPNGDGANDVFYPRGTGLFKIKTLRIFNRWGELVFEKNSVNANDPSAGWDGTYKGVKLPADVFVYMIDVICDNNSVLPYKGNVALIQ
ncbi:MAG: PKD domain-containing protein [Ferruginibacter sp.]